MADPDESSEDAENGHQYSTPDPRFQTQVLLVALLEQACNRYCDDSDLCGRLFKKMCSMLVTRLIIPAEFAQDSYAVFRDQWLTSLQTMMSKAAEECQRQPSESSDKNAALVPVHGALTRSMSAPAGPPSRYQSEFIQIERLGSGAFGCVYKAKHKLDKQYFAVKKLYSHQLTPGLWAEIRREVELLASLRHQHVVAYNSSWVEYQPNTTTCGNALTDACEEQMDVAILDELEESDDEQLKVIFDNQSSSKDVASSNILSTDFSDMSSTTCPYCHKIRRQAVTADVICPCSRRRHTSSNPDDVIDDDDAIRMRKSRDLKRTSSYDPELVRSRVAIRSDYSNVLLQGRITVCIQMQLCDRSLKQWLQTRNDKAALEGDVFSSIEPAENARIFYQTLMAVDYIHRQGIVHRDLKPGNIFLHGETNCVKIGDFGLARTLIDSEPASGSPLSAGLGTPLYYAPEQKGTKYDHKCDMYSLGIILYELYHPFVTESERINVLNILRDSNIVATEVRRLYRSIVDCILSLTARNPDKRPSAGQLLSHKVFNKPDNEKSKLRYENRRNKKRIRQLQKDLLKIKLNSPIKTENSDS